MAKLKMLSWNVNGIRAALKKGFLEWFHQQEADIIFIQETKVQPGQEPDELKNLDGYHTYFSSCETKKGYSGTAMFTKHKPISVTHSLGGDPKFDVEGRIICAEFPEFVV